MPSIQFTDDADYDLAGPNGQRERHTIKKGTVQHGVSEGTAARWERRNKAVRIPAPIEIAALRAPVAPPPPPPPAAGKPSDDTTGDDSAAETAYREAFGGEQSNTEDMGNSGAAVPPPPPPQTSDAPKRRGRPAKAVKEE